MYNLLDEQQLIAIKLKSFANTKKRAFSDDFKYTMVYYFFNFGTPKDCLINEYNLSKSVLNKWISLYQNGEPFSGKKKRKTLEERELIKLKEMIARLGEENKKLNTKLDTLTQLLENKVENDAMKLDVLFQCLCVNIPVQDKIKIVKEIKNNNKDYPLDVLCKLLNLSKNIYLAEAL